MGPRPDLRRSRFLGPLAPSVIGQGVGFVLWLFRLSLGFNRLGGLDNPDDIPRYASDRFTYVRGVSSGLPFGYNRVVNSKGGRMRGFGWQELLVILAIAALLFGGKKIPEVAKGLGEGIKNFKNALKSDEKVAEQPEEKKQA